jgi:hypothetical protein
MHYILLDIPLTAWNSIPDPFLNLLWRSIPNMTADINAKRDATTHY